MKTVLLINASGARYFRRVNNVWQPIDKPVHNDRLWVIANLPEEILETFKLPLLFGRDRRNFLDRRLVAAFPNSHYRAAPIISGGLLTAGTAVLTGLSTSEAVTSKLDKLEIPVAGVWGMAMLLTLLARQRAITSVVLALPSVHYLRILVLKDGVPVLTRCVHRYSEDNNKDNDNDANEILRTRQHLENRHIFEHDAIPPVLYLGDTASVSAHLNEAGLTLLPVPESLSPDGEAGYLHSVFEYVVSSPRGQLAPLQLRVGHLSENIRRAAYAGCAASLLAAMLFGQQDFRALINLYGREQVLKADLRIASNEREQLAASIVSTGLDPLLVRQATRFAALEMDAAPTPRSLLQLAARTIADLPQVRIKSLSFRFPKQGETYCQGHNVIELPLVNQQIDLSSLSGDKPSDSGKNTATGVPLRHAELQFSILLTEELTPAAQIEVRKRISAVLKTETGLQLMLDPAAFSLINTLKGGIGINTPQTENLWCMSIPWISNSREVMP